MVKSPTASSRRTGFRWRTKRASNVRMESTAALVFSLVSGAVLGCVIILAPVLLVVLVFVLAVLGVCGYVLFGMLRGCPWWLRFTLLTVGAQLILNYGFASIAIGAGSAKSTLSELVLVAALFPSLALILDRSQPMRLPAFLVALLVIEFCFVAVRLPMGLSSYGMVAARDALPHVQTLFALPGFVAARLVLDKRIDTSFLPRSALVLVVACAVYGILYPWQRTVLGLSPAIPSLRQSIPLVGYFASWPVVPVVGMLACLSWMRLQQPGASIARAIALVCLLAFGASFLAVQSRAGYLMTLFLMPWLLVAGKQGHLVAKLATFASLGILALAVLEMSGLEVRGRVANITLTSAIDHLASSSGVAENSQFSGAAAGVTQRKSWIDQSLRLWGHDLGSQLFGIGYGEPLTDFRVGGAYGGRVEVREPHNSYISVLTRQGLFIFMIWLSFHAWLISRSLVTARRCQARGEAILASVSVVVGAYMICCMVEALVEPVFENPWFVVPYFFACGIQLAIYQRTPFGTRRASSALQNPTRTMAEVAR